MKISIRLYNKDRESKKGYPVKIVASHLTKTKRKNIGIYSKLRDWDNNKGEPLKSHPNYVEIMPVLLNIKSRIFHAEQNCTSKTEAINYVLEKGLVQTVSFYEFSETLMSEFLKVGRTGNAEVYDTSIKQLKYYKGSVRFSDLTYNFLTGFKNWKLQNASKNTVNLYLRTLRAIYNEAVRRGCTEDNEPFKGIFNDIKVRANRTRKRFLEKEQVKVLETLELEGGNKKARDLLLLQFYLGGVDLFDLYNARKEQIRDGRIYFFRGKVEGYEFDLNIFDKAGKILEEYRVEGAYLLDFDRENVSYKSVRDTVNRNLKQVQQKHSVHLVHGGNLTTKVARHTFANIGKRIYIDPDMLRELMGHERNDVDTIYKDRFPEKERDTWHWKIID